jgi:CheY-like chemotaxis protein/anti-sigma regulatory factor (Ser/Thr protein kinase)
LEIATFIHPNTPKYLQGDISRLRQILLNLTNNAIKFTNQGEVIIEVSLESELANSVHLRFAVIDTGIGIPESSQSKLFRPFIQVDASTTRKYGGTGLGLAICKQLVELMGGEIHLESEEHKGSTFWFTVPLQRQFSKVNKNNSLKIENLKGLKVLVVDDSITNCNILYHQLKAWGMEVDIILQSPEVIPSLHRAIEIGQPYQVALLDMQMPDLDGEQLGIQIKSSPILKDIHLIMLTSIDQSGAASRMLEIGFADYLCKPVRKARPLADPGRRAALRGLLGFDGAALSPRHALDAVRAGRLLAFMLPWRLERPLLVMHGRPIAEQPAMRAVPDRAEARARHAIAPSPLRPCSRTHFIPDEEPDIDRSCGERRAPRS